MWITDKVDLPVDLLEAQASGEFVVFAGAGVSMGPPSELPDFEGLADHIADGCLKRRPGEPVDRFLGRLIEERGVQVHQRAAERIGDRRSSPNDVHRLLLSLFGSPEDLRVVTTNFDRHFTTVLSETFSTGVEQFYAPALPLGHDFRGLIHLHGSVEKHPRSLILTDSDFGRAYLTDGWATRFLEAMFRSYTTLFVGYSHSDPVMTYLARALTPEARLRRFALTADDDIEKWKSLGITPILYPLQAGDTVHKELVEALSAWRNLAKMGVLDKETRIKTILGQPMPLRPPDSDFLKKAVSDPVAITFFVQSAKDALWLKWIEGHPEFESLFREGAHEGEVHAALTWWFANNFLLLDPDQAMEIIRGHNQQISASLWAAIAHRLAHGKPEPDVGTFSKWVALLLASPISALGKADLLCPLLEKCGTSEYARSAVMLIEELTRPRLVLRPSFLPPASSGSPGRQVQAEIEIRGEPYTFRRVWDKVLRPQLALLSDRLAPILAEHIRRGHDLFRCFGQANDNYDPICATRSAIEPHDQDAHHQGGIYVVIDTAREVVESIVARQERGSPVILDEWALSDAPLLRRLAVHGFAECKGLTPDEKIDLLVARGWLYAYPLRHEVYHLIGKSYPVATESSRSCLVDAALRGPQGKDGEHLDDDHRDYEIFNLLSWLSRSAPQCGLTQREFQKLQAAHPTFGSRDHADLYSWISVGFRGPRSPITAEGLTATPPEERIEWLLAYKGEAFHGPDRDGLLTVVTSAAVTDFPWAWGLAESLVRRSAWETDLWGALAKGWRETPLKPTELVSVLKLFTAHPRLLPHAMEVAELLRKHFDTKDDQAPAEALTDGEALAARLTDQVIGAPAEPERNLVGDWLTTAINNPGGDIGEFWLNAISIRRHQAGDGWAGLPEGCKQGLGVLVSGPSFLAQMSRVVFASRLEYLYEVDQAWTREHLLPAFDWSTDERTAQQCWDGFLFNPIFSEPLLGELMPQIKATFEKVDKSLSHRRREFCSLLGAIAIYSPAHPPQSGWLDEFLLKTDEESRAEWAQEMCTHLDGLKDEGLRELWARWLGEYWRRRNTGVPVRLSDQEKQHMAAWVTELKPVFEEAVTRVLAMPPPVRADHRTYWVLAAENFAGEHPVSTARLVNFLLKEEQRPFYSCSDLHGIFDKLSTGQVEASTMLKLRDEMARLGCS